MRHIKQKDSEHFHKVIKGTSIAVCVISEQRKGHENISDQQKRRRKADLLSDATAVCRSVIHGNRVWVTQAYSQRFKSCP